MVLSCLEFEPLFWLCFFGCPFPPNKASSAPQMRRKKTQRPGSAVKATKPTDNRAPRRPLCPSRRAARCLPGRAAGSARRRSAAWRAHPRSRVGGFGGGEIPPLLLKQEPEVQILKPPIQFMLGWSSFLEPNRRVRLPEEPRTLPLTKGEVIGVHGWFVYVR